MRIICWLVIAVFVSTLFWPQLLDDKSIIYCLCLFFLFLIIPRLHILAVIPIAAVYFTLYVNLTLTGSLPLAVLNSTFPFTNATALQAVVDGKDHSILVRVNSLINEKNRGYFTAELMELDGHPLNYSPRLEMRWYNPTLDVQDGQIQGFIARIKPVYGRANPAGFDRQKWRYSQHIAYQANIRKHVAELSAGISLRAYFYQKVQALSASLNNRGILLALAFADKTQISADKKEQIRKLAISHLFAISGLHIGLLFSFVYLLAHLLVSHFIPHRYLGWSSWRIVNVLALAAAFFYAYLAGFSLPTQRAFLMLLFAVLVLSMKRKCGLFDLITVTLFAILLWDPLAVLSLSLWLSFSAVAIILIVIWRFPSVALFQRQEETKSRFLVLQRYFKFLLLIQLSLTLLMLPVQLLYFSAFSWLAPFINFIAVPLFSLLIIPLVLLGCLFSLFAGSLALPFLSAADYLIGWFFAFFNGGEAAYQSYSTVFGQLLILLLSLSVVLFIICSQVRNNRLTSFVFSLVVLILGAVSFWQRETKDAEVWFVEGLDVGQGLAVLVRSQGQTMLYDSGPRYPSGFTSAASEIVPYLQALGVTRLDYVLISHSDIDHAGGLQVMMDYFNPKQLILGEPLIYYASDKFSSCKAGQSWSLGALSVEVLSPFSLGNNNNNNSCVVRLSDGQYSLLLTGDIEKKQELQLIDKQGKKLASDLLLAPHHGSKHSSSVPFIQAVSPQWVIFSAGFMNQWRFPAEEVKLRYKNQSVKMINSGISGFIRFKIEKGQIKMQTYREDLAAYWYHHSFSL